MIDEMSDTFVDEMDVDSVDETRKFGSSGYFGEEKYDSKDDHLCRDGHSHDADDHYEGGSSAYFDDTRYEAAKERAEREFEKKVAGTHLCDDHEHKEYKKPAEPAKDMYSPKYTAADFSSIPDGRIKVTDEEIPSGDFNPDGGTNRSIPGSADEALSGSINSGPAAADAKAKADEILSRSSKPTVTPALRPYDFGDTGGTDPENSNEKAVNTVLVLMIVFGICTGMFPLTIIGVILMVRRNNYGKVGSGDEVRSSSETDPKDQTVMIIKIVVLVGALIVICGVLRFLISHASFRF